MTRAIIGGGLSGTLTAVPLMRRAVEADQRIVPIHRSSLLARGVASGTRRADDALNVSAVRMSAFESGEGHFLPVTRVINGTGPAPTSRRHASP